MTPVPESRDTHYWFMVDMFPDDIVFETGTHDSFVRIRNQVYAAKSYEKYLCFRAVWGLDGIFQKLLPVRGWEG